MPRSPINWGLTLADVARDRAQPHPIREERLRTTMGIRGGPAVSLVGWRGLRGRRYVFEIHDLAEAAALIRTTGRPVVALGVRRDAAGLAEPVRPTWFGADASPEGFLDAIGRDGCTEVHLHRLADSEAEARAVVADIDASQAASLGKKAA